MRRPRHVWRTTGHCGSTRICGGQHAAYSRAWTTSANIIASDRVPKAAMKASPMVFTSYPRYSAMAERMRELCSCKARFMCSEHAFQMAVDCTMSVNTMVAVVAPSSLASCSPGGVRDVVALPATSPSSNNASGK
eukprot:gene1065-biopygen1074